MCHSSVICKGEGWEAFEAKNQVLSEMVKKDLSRRNMAPNGQKHVRFITWDLLGTFARLPFFWPFFQKRPFLSPPPLPSCIWLEEPTSYMSREQHCWNLISFWNIEGSRVQIRCNRYNWKRAEKEFQGRGKRRLGPLGGWGLSEEAFKCDKCGHQVPANNTLQLVSYKYKIQIQIQMYFLVCITPTGHRN